MKKALLTYFLILAITVCIFPQAQAQNTDIAKKDLVREGNKLYKMAEYAASDSLFAAAAALDSTYSTALYNLGNSSYLGGNPGTAKAAWMKSLLNTADEKGKTDIFYNLAGIEMDGKNYGEAIKLYKDALRRDPTDEQARYNLALAQKLLKDQQQNQNNQNNQQNQQDQNNQDNKNDNKDNKDNQDDKNKDNNNKDNNKDKDNNKNNDDNKDNQDDKNKDNNQNNNDNNDNKDNKDKDKDNNNNGDNKDDKNNQNGPSGGNTPQQQQLSPDAQQMLRAIGREEQKTQDKVKGKKVQGAVKKAVKDW